MCLFFIFLRRNYQSVEMNKKFEKKNIIFEFIQSLYYIVEKQTIKIRCKAKQKNVSIENIQTRLHAETVLRREED